MSLFPAYGDGKPNSKSSSAETTSNPATATTAEAIWQTNFSYELPVSRAVVAVGDTSSETDTEHESDIHGDSLCYGNSPHETKDAPKPRSLEFDNMVEFYVDKKPVKGQRDMYTLPSVLRPRYKKNSLRLADNLNTTRHVQKRSTKKKRSYRRLQVAVPDVDLKQSEEESNEIMKRIRKLKAILAQQPMQLSRWVELHNLLSHNLTKSNRLSVAEHQLHTLEKAMQHLPGNQSLLQLYVSTLSSTYPDSEVATRIKQLLEGNPFDYTLWTALIMTTQGTMARCNVPDVLNIYEQCMRRMNFRQNDGDVDMDMDTDANKDDLMLKLFHNCALFLRQSANCDRMFALLKLALELNTQDQIFECLEANAAAERPLVEFEELVLGSGMPMPEIWTRIERLRQAYNFLPYPQLRGSLDDAANAGLDQQRFIYTEDVCRYIYPLKSKDKKCHLMLLAIQLTKLPFVRSNSLADRLSARIDQIGDSEAVEMLLATLGDRHSYLMAQDPCGQYTVAMLQLAKEMSVSPSFMPHFCGSELYEQCLGNLLLQCSECFKDAHEENQRRVFIILWFRFERLRLMLLKLNGKLTDRYVRDARLRQRQLLRLEPNRQVTRFFTELAMFEYEAADDSGTQDDRAFGVFAKIMNLEPNLNNVELLHANVVYAEMLFSRNQHEKARHILSCLVMQQSSQISLNVEVKDVMFESDRLLNDAFQMATEDGFKSLESMPLEQYFLPNKLMLLLRTHCLLLCLNGRSSEVLHLLNGMSKEATLAYVEVDSEEETGMEMTRSRFMREELRELQLVMMQLPSPWNCSRNGRKKLIALLQQSLLEFPRNLVMLQTWSTLCSLPWYKLRGHLVNTKAGILALLNMVIAARCRFHNQVNSSGLMANDELFAGADSLQQAYLENVVRTRVLNMFETFLPSNPHRSKAENEQYAVLRRNSLYWRCYLRALSNENTSFERSKACLLMALDECPWDKALYVDGIMYAPQELGNLQDVMSEKQLRIYAIPEELSVLREE